MDKKACVVKSEFFNQLIQAGIARYEPDYSATASEFYDSMESYQKDINFILEIFDKNVTSVLDAGGGTGRVAIPLALKGYSVTCLDESEWMLEKARKKAENSNVKGDLKFVQASFTDMMLDTKYSVILNLLNGIGHLVSNDELRKFFANTSHLIDDDGYLLVDWTTLSEAVYWSQWGRYWPELIQYKTLNYMVTRYSQFDRESKIRSYEICFHNVYDSPTTSIVTSFQQRIWTRDEVIAAALDSGLVVKDEFWDYKPHSGQEECPDGVNVQILFARG